MPCGAAAAISESSCSHQDTHSRILEVATTPLAEGSSFSVNGFVSALTNAVSAVAAPSWPPARLGFEMRAGRCAASARSGRGKAGELPQLPQLPPTPQRPSRRRVHANTAGQCNQSVDCATRACTMHPDPARVDRRDP